MALFPAPATLVNQNISALPVRLGWMIQFQMCSRSAFRVPSKQVNSGSQEAPSTYQSLSSVVFRVMVDTNTKLVSIDQVQRWHTFVLELVLHSGQNLCEIYTRNNHRVELECQIEREKCQHE